MDTQNKNLLEFTLDPKSGVPFYKQIILQIEMAIAEYEKAGRDELAAKERQELSIIEEYMPEQMIEEEVEKLVREVISDTGASSMKDMGKVMGKVMPIVKGKADGKLVNETVKKFGRIDIF